MEITTIFPWFPSSNVNLNIFLLKNFYKKYVFFIDTCYLIHCDCTHEWPQAHDFRDPKNRYL